MDDLAATRFVTTSEVAELRGAHPKTVRVAIERGDLVGWRVGNQFVIRREDAMAWTPRRRGRPTDEERFRG